MAGPVLVVPVAARPLGLRRGGIRFAALCACTLLLCVDRRASTPAHGTLATSGSKDLAFGYTSVEGSPFLECSRRGRRGSTAARYLPKPETIMVSPGKRLQMLDWAMGKQQALRRNFAFKLIGMMILMQAVHMLGHLLLPAAAHTCGHCSHVAHHGIKRGMGLVWWMAEPGVPDATYGGLCVYSNIFFLPLAPFFWLRRKVPELLMVVAVAAASTVYHVLQVHAGFGPAHAWTKLACMSDIVMALSLTAFLGLKYPKTRTRALPAISAAALCFLIPTILPAGKIAQVGYSLLHSAWHGLSALAAYACVGGRARAVVAPLKRAFSLKGAATSLCGLIASCVQRYGTMAQTQSLRASMFSFSR